MSMSINEMMAEAKTYKWWECAPTNGVEPPTAEEASKWMETFMATPVLQRNVWHRYVVGRSGREKFINWLREKWFFTNFTSEQLQLIHNTILITIQY